MIYHVCQLAVSPLLTGSYVRVYEYTYDFDNIGWNIEFSFLIISLTKKNIFKES